MQLSQAWTLGQLSGLGQAEDWASEIAEAGGQAEWLLQAGLGGMGHGQMLELGGWSGWRVERSSWILGQASGLSSPFKNIIFLSLLLLFLYFKNINFPTK